MELYNVDQKKYYLSIDVKKDLDVTSFLCEVDGKQKEIMLSNIGHYALYLGDFTCCKFDESKDYNVSLQPYTSSFDEAIKSYSLSLLQTIEEKATQETLYEDLPIEPTERIYHIFRRLLCLLKTAILAKDSLQKVWIIEEVKKQQKLNYSGLTNYSGNWWIYEIGIPRCLNEILFLCYYEMDPYEMTQILAIENFYIPQAEYEYYRRNYPNIHRIKTDYANLADTIYICLSRSILLQDSDGIKKLASLVPQLLKITESGNGFYPDGSFLYHTNIPYNASYGEVLLNALVKNLELFHKIRWNIEEYMEVIYERIEKSYLPFLYHQRALDCVRGRACSRKAGENYSYKRIMKSLSNLVNLYAPKGFIDILYNEEEAHYYASKAYSFQYMNRYIKRNNDYLLAISACSDTVANYESINGENLLGSYQGNFTYELYYNRDPEQNDALKINPFYRKGSTNVLCLEQPNQMMQNNITAGVAYQDILTTCFHQKNQVEGYFSKFVLKNSLVSIGSNIHSNTDYISTLYTFDEDGYTLTKNMLETNVARLIFKKKPCIRRFSEERSYLDLNMNESNEKFLFSQNRVYYENPSQYEYQLYPKKMCVLDEYEVTLLPEAHILSYQNLLLWNSFSDSPLEYKGIYIEGKASMIFVFKEEEIEVYFTSNVNQELKIKVEGYTSKLAEKAYIVKDKLTHCIRFRRCV